jgi:hypothetical protein
MIEESVKIHDKFSVEIKLGFIARKKQKISHFAVNTWLFIPNSLDINPLTYEKKDFYRDLKSNIRLITPIYLLRDIASGNNSPFMLLEKSFLNLASNPSRTNAADYEYHIKMFLSILKSALRNDIEHIAANSIGEDKIYLLKEFGNSVERIIERYRNLRRIINASTISKELFNFYLFGDEFMSNVIEQHAFKLLERLDTSTHIDALAAKSRITQIIRNEIEYKKEMGYPIVEKKEVNSNRELIFRLGLLKKFAENELFLTTNKKRDGILVEQIYYSIAAGISMIFATAIAFSIQLKYGNFTIPLFAALVVSYMLKDRIKELSRHYFAHKLGKRYFDHKTKINLKNTNIGWSKEAMDFITEDKIPDEVLKIRNRSAILEANNRSFSERIILYRKLVKVFRYRLDTDTQYITTGINDIIRFNISGFVTKMDNPMFPLYFANSNDKISIVKGERPYYLNLVIQLNNEEQTVYKRYRLVLNRNGILDIEKY